MRAFVTGATGFLGRRLVDRLLADGHNVTALVRSHEHGLPSAVTTIPGQLPDDADALDTGLARIDVIFHLAAFVSFDPHQSDRLLHVNAEGTRVILSAARDAGVAKTVVVSSACTIGLARRSNSLLDESTPTNPTLLQRNPYMCSKCAAEAYAIEAAAKGLNVIIVNPTTVFGPGDRSLNSGTLVKQVAESAVVPVPAGGSNVVNIDDVIEGILAAACKGQPGARYILGGENLYFSEIYRQIANVVGRAPLFVSVPRFAKPAMTALAWAIQRITGSRLITPQIVADTFAFKFFSSARAERELGWKARRTFSDTLAAAWDYYQREGLIKTPTRTTAWSPAPPRRST